MALAAALTTGKLTLLNSLDEPYYVKEEEDDQQDRRYWHYESCPMEPDCKKTRKISIGGVVGNADLILVQSIAPTTWFTTYNLVACTTWK
jgi:hypothetical protein